MRFSVLRRTITGFLEVGVWNRFIGFGVNAVGFSTALLLDLHQSGILQLPQGVDRLLPPAVEQFHYLIDGIVEVNAPIFVRPAVFPGQVCPAQDKGIQYLCFVGQGCECGGFKKEIGKPGKADRLFRLMDINGVCHIVFCGRLEACFRGQTVVSIACPCSVLAKPCKSRTFQPLTVHTRPPFPFTFCFLPPVNSGGAVGAVFSPVGFGDEHTAADRPAFQVPAPVNLRFQRPGKRQDRPPKPLAADRERNGLGAGVGIPIVKEHTIPVLITAALPADQGVCLFPLCRCHAVKGTVRLALYGRQSFIWVLSHVFPPFFLCRSPRKGFLPRRRKLRIVRFTASGKTHSLRCSSSPHKAMRLCGDPDNGGVFRRWHAPRTSGHFVPKWLVAVLPLPGYSFSDGHSFFKVQLIDELP